MAKVTLGKDNGYFECRGKIAPCYFSIGAGRQNSPKCYFASSAKTALNQKVGTCTTIIAAQTCGATILLEIALASQLFLNDCADPCATSILAILSTIAQVQFKNCRLRKIVFQSNVIKV